MNTHEHLAKEKPALPITHRPVYHPGDSGGLIRLTPRAFAIRKAGGVTFDPKAFPNGALLPRYGKRLVRDHSRYRPHVGAKQLAKQAARAA